MLQFYIITRVQNLIVYSDYKIVDALIKDIEMELQFRMLLCGGKLCHTNDLIDDIMYDFPILLYMIVSNIKCVSILMAHISG